MEEVEKRTALKHERRESCASQAANRESNRKGQQGDGSEAHAIPCADFVSDVLTQRQLSLIFSVFVRGMIGVYQHCGKAHFSSYLGEFDFRYNRRSGLGLNEEVRAVSILASIVVTPHR